MAREWHAKAGLWSVKINALVSYAHGVLWRRHQNGDLAQALYVPAPAPFLEAPEVEEEDEPGDVLQTMRVAVQGASSSSSAAGDYSAHIEKEGGATLLLNPLQTFDSPQERAAQAHADRWTEESMAVQMLDQITWADYVPEDRWWDLDAVFRMGMQYVDEFNNRLVHQWNM